MDSSGFTRDGIVKDEQTGEKYLPATQRPDGTWRKPRRVKDGYIPQEEVPVYENRGVQWMKSRSNLPPGLDPELAAQATSKPESECVTPAGLSKSAKKNLKRKEKKKKETIESVDNVTAEMALTAIVDKPKAPRKETAKAKKPSQEPINEDGKDYQTTAPTAEPAKRLKNLKKKLRQIDELKAKFDSGELKEPTKEQQEKIDRRRQTLCEIEELEAQIA